MNNFVANPDYIQREMMEEIGVKNFEELFDMIPKEPRIYWLDLPDGKSEMETQKIVKSIAKKNNVDYKCFLGGGAYQRFIPACVAQISSRFEFNTAYTPYQPEISQGTLQVIYEFQSMICDLTGMNVSNASVYDAGNACAEAVLMSARISNRKKILVSSAINPEYLEVVKTYCDAADIEVELINTIEFKTDINSIKEKVSTQEYAGILIQVPNYFGSIEDMTALSQLNKDPKTSLIICADVMSLAALKKPSEYGADIVVGDVQSFGNPVNFGGPYAGFIATTDKHKRQLAGRIVGRTLDAGGKQAFTLTLQAREQHIRRQKATSNICSNQALVALNSTVYLSVMGKNGVKQAAYLSSKNAHVLAQSLEKKGYKILNKDIFNEFVLEVDNADEFISRMKSEKILAGIKIDENKILVCTTELISAEDIEYYLQKA